MRCSDMRISCALVLCGREDSSPKSHAAAMRSGHTPARCPRESTHVCWHREWMGPGGSRGLQNRCGAAFVVPGGFDSLALPPRELLGNLLVQGTLDPIAQSVSRRELIGST